MDKKPGRLTEYQYIKDLIHDYKFDEAYYMFSSYLEKYSYNNFAKCEYANLLIAMKKFDEAKLMIDSLEKDVVNFRSNSRNFLAVIKLKYYMVTCDYLKAYELLNNSGDLNLDDEKVLIHLFLRKKLGLPEITISGRRSYFKDMIVDYDYNRLLSHIEAGHVNVRNENKDDLKFNHEVDIYSLYDKIKTSIKPENRIPWDLLLDEYFFKYENAGKADGKSVDYIKVYSLVNSSDIITFFPYKNIGLCDYVDLTPEVKTSSKQKRISQIDKFNQRYGKRID